MTPPTWRPRRIAWLLTHASLRSAEVPVLRSLGCEVWVQKAFPDAPGYRSCSADPRWDEGSTLPPDALADLNAFDFYTRPITPRIAGLLAEHFDLAVIDGNAPVKTREVLTHFPGPVLMRAFGMEDPVSYSRLHFAEFHPGLARALLDNYGRFWFGAFYPEVIPHENELLRRRAFHLPICLPEGAWRREGTWEGGDGRVFFVCPSANDDVHCHAIYANFKHAFGDLPHVIAGRQDVPVNDPNVTGFLPGDEYGKLFRRVQVMYYHSQEPRHLHYHPLEAMTSGMPVVYLRGGLLEKYDTGSQAGACADEAEAHEKLRRVLAGDRPLIAAIRASQRTAVDKWRPETARTAWGRWLDLFAPDASGAVPARQLWDDRPPPRMRADAWEMPYLDPNASHAAAFVRKVLRAGWRYLEAAAAERTLLPRRIRRIERFRDAVGRLFGVRPTRREAA